MDGRNFNDFPRNRPDQNVSNTNFKVEDDEQKEK